MMMISGRMRSSRVTIERHEGSSAFGIPLMPVRLASKCTEKKTPRKYSSAGTMAMTMISLYGIWVYSAMMNAAAPMIGGMIWPPVEAVASVAAATCGRNPAFFMIGMVNEPEATVLATEEPDTMP